MIDSVLLSLPAEFVALSARLRLPSVVGVPLILPVPVSTDKPSGSPDAPKLVGLLLAAI
ncbi:MAG TPA: hypothetical protein VGP72_16990 [Planctomycetota bacterium]